MGDCPLTDSEVVEWFHENCDGFPVDGADAQRIIVENIKQFGEYMHVKGFARGMNEAADILLSRITLSLPFGSDANIAMKGCLMDIRATAKQKVDKSNTVGKEDKRED